MIYSHLDRATIDAAIAGAPACYVPLLVTVRDLGLGILSVPQGNRAFAIPQSDRPMVAIIGDDTSHALGPSGFHSKSVAQLLEWAECAVVIACAPSPLLYGAAAVLAGWQQLRTVIVETRPAQEQAWILFVETANPAIRICIGTANGGTA